MTNTGGILSILESWLKSLFYTKAEIDTNSATWSSTYNSTYDSYGIWAYNQTTPALSSANSYTDSRMVLNDMHNHSLLNVTGVDTNVCSGTDKVVNVTFNNGNLSVACAADQSTPGLTIKTQRVDVSTTDGTVWSATNLNFNVDTSKNYTLKCDILYTGAAATTGQAINLSTTATTADVNIMYNTWSSATASVGFSAISFATALTGTGSGATVVRPNLIIADFRTTSTGTINLGIRSEVAGSATTLKRGSMCTLYDVTNSA
jgi:hypothetical protein